MAVTLQRRIRYASPKEAVQVLRGVLEQVTKECITPRLLASIESGSVPPPLFGAWLGIARSPDTILQALKQTFSIEVRKLAIKQLSKLLRSARWKETWDGLGGVPGLLDIFSDLSVRDMKNICHAIGGCAKTVDVDEKRKAVADFFMALQPYLFPNATYRTKDQRPLQHYYRRLLPDCTKEVVSSVAEQDLANLPKSVRKRLLHCHADVLQTSARRYVFENNSAGEVWLSPLLSGSPPDTSSNPGFSDSMEFALEILRGATEEGTSLSDEWFALELAEPLLRRALRKKADWSRVQEIVDLITTYIEGHRGVAQKLEERLGGTYDDGNEWYLTGGILSLVARCWSRKPDLFERQLRLLLSWSHDDAEKVEIDQFAELFTGVTRPQRYILLKLCIEVTTGKNLDVEDDLKDLRGTLTYEILSSILPSDALGLFKRMSSAKGNDVHLGTGTSHDSVLMHSPEPESYEGDARTWRIVLLQKNGRHKEAEKLAAVCVQECEKTAMSQSVPKTRAFYAKAALNYAVASVSIEMYKEALQWARRFVRDPLVARELYQYQQRDVITLLSGVPNNISRNTTAETLRKRIEAANEILMGLFDTVCSSLREPSFTVHHWHGTLSLPACVSEERINRSTKLKKHLNLSDDDVYDILWADTLNILVELEEKALQPGHERLMVDSVKGLLDYHYVGPISLKDQEPSTYRFLDELAKARNELWRKHRPTIHPAAATLPAPFPRGLPIQHLTKPYVLETADLQGLAPYIASRVDDAIFLDPKLALTPFPTDEETQAAIGGFVDAYAFALKLFLPDSLSDNEKRMRADKAWAHATGPLSQGRMTEEEAERYWQKSEIIEGQFTDMWPLEPWAKPASDEWPRFPSVASETVAEEWNPMPPERADKRSRKVEPATYIDYSKNMRRQLNGPNVHFALGDASLSIPAVKEDGIWSAAKTERAETRPMMREALILSALLYLDTFNSTKSRVLSTPFSQGEIRYPAVYLDESFLSQELNIEAGLYTLEAHAAFVPPVLLSQLARNALQMLDATDLAAKGYVDVERRAFRLIQVLAQSDRPALASELVIRTLISRPDASSWHRRYLKSGFLETLPASEAQRCIAAFADAIIARLEEQAKAREAKDAQASRSEVSGFPTEAGQEIEKQPFVKVTTIKFLAQILKDADFVSDEYALAILMKLINKASHVDIRHAVINSLLSVFQTASPELAKKALSALETIISLAGNIRERSPVTDTEWTHAEETSSPPELDINFNFNDSAPTLSLLFAFLALTKEGFEHRAAYVDRIILPIINRLKQQTAKWTFIFLHKHGFDFSAQEELNIPSLPLDKAVLTELLRRGSSHLPLSLLDEYVSYISFKIAPPAPIVALNKKLKDDASLKGQRDTQIWLARFGEDLDIATYFRVFNLTQLLDEPSQLQNHITPKDIQAAFLKLYTVMLWHDNPQQTHLDYLTHPLWRFSKGAEVDEKWGGYYKPIVEAMILYTEGLRTREWQKDPNRHPKVLPDTFQYRMWLLQYAAQHSSEATSGDREAHCKAFADRVAQIIEQISGSLYHSKFGLLKEAMEYMRNDDRLRVACHLGDISKTTLSWLTMLDHLRIELAVELLRTSQGDLSGDKELEKRVEALKESWKMSESEEVRRFGFSLEEEEE